MPKSNNNNNNSLLTSFQKPKSQQKSEEEQYYEQMKNENNIRGYISNTVTSPIDIKNVTGIKTRRFHVGINGSLNMFNANPKLAQAKVGTDWAIKYRPTHSKKGTERTGDPTKGVIRKATINWAQNDLPCDVIISSNLFPGNVYTSVDQQRGFIVVPPGRHNYNDQPIFLPIKQDVESKLLSSYSNLTEKHLQHQAFTTPDGTYYMIPEDSFVHKVLKMNETSEDDPTQHYDMDEMSLGTGYAWIPEDLYDASVGALRGDVLNQLAFQDLTNHIMTIEPAGAKDWGEALDTKYHANEQESRWAVCRDSVGGVSLGMQFQYTLSEMPSKVEEN